MTSARSTATDRRRSSDTEDDLTARDVVDAVDTLRRAISKYGLVALAIFGMGGGAAVLTIPKRLEQVERDHIALKRGQMWLICVVRERDRQEGDVTRCDRLLPARFDVQDEDPGM